jgi:hypothetical protein
MPSSREDLEFESTIGPIRLESMNFPTLLPDELDGPCFDYSMIIGDNKGPMSALTSSMR